MTERLTAMVIAKLEELRNDKRIIDGTILILERLARERSRKSQRAVGSPKPRRSKTQAGPTAEVDGTERRSP